MDFSAFVPAAVRDHLSHYLEGERGIPGYIDLLEHANMDVARRSDAISEYSKKWAGEFDLADDPWLERLRKEHTDAVSHRDMLASEVDCLQRLAHDERMRDAFALLTQVIANDQQWRDFSHSAWASRVDFAKYRHRLKQAAELKDEIADAAETLANVLRRFSDTGVDGPTEFYSIPDLLRKTDNHEMQGHNLYMWRAMRRYVLGDLRKDDIPATKPAAKGGESPPNTEIRIAPMGKKANLDREEDTRNMLRYAWGTAPDFSALLGTMANAARGFKPSESGMIGAAILSRQGSPKTEYLRAFGSLLVNYHHFTLTKAIMQAMAIVANVVINEPDVDVTYDDVRKALAKLRSERLENSGKD